MRSVSGILTEQVKSQGWWRTATRNPVLMPTRARITLTVLVASLCSYGAQPQDGVRNDRNQINKALRTISPFVRDAMGKTGVPGVAVAVVYRDRLVYLEGFGVRKAGGPDAITPDTVFQLA